MAIEKKVTPRKRRKSAKGRLIKGMTRKLPSSLFESPYFKVALVKVMKHFSGIYALYKGGELYYVGLTRDLYPSKAFTMLTHSTSSGSRQTGLPALLYQ